jgi:hypothetical protein
LEEHFSRAAVMPIADRNISRGLRMHAAHEGCVRRSSWVLQATGGLSVCSNCVCWSAVAGVVRLLLVTGEPYSARFSSGDLGALLVLLHNAELSATTSEITYRVWRHQERLKAALLADAEQQQRGGAGIQTFSYGEIAEPVELEETVRIWRDGDRARVEHHGGPRDGYYAVADGLLWWMWDERNGAHSNQDDPSVGSNVTEELQVMLDPTPLLSSLRFEPAGDSQVAGRLTISAHGIPRPQDRRRGPPAFELNEIGMGADYYELEVDRQFGVLLCATAIRDGKPFHKIATLAAAFDQPIPDDTFRFKPPTGEPIQTRTWQESQVEHVTLVQAQQRAPFTVLMPDTVPTNWQVQCRLIRPSERPPSPMQIGVIYTSTDGHESISLSQFPAGGSNPYRELSHDDEKWETVTRNGIEMKTRPARWGQAQVELERDGTFVHLMSDNLTRDQVLTIAAGLRPAPTTSSI